MDTDLFGNVVKAQFKAIKPVKECLPVIRQESPKKGLSGRYEDGAMPRSIAGTAKEGNTVTIWH